MVYRRRRYGRRRSYRRKFTRRNRRTGLKKTIRRVVNRMSETKRFQYPMQLTFNAITTSWTYAPPTISQSTAQLGSRIGRKIALTSMSFCGTLRGGQSNISTDDKINTVRIVCLVAKCNGDQVSSLTPLSGVGISDPIWKTGPVGANYSQLLLSRVITLASPAPDSVGYMPAYRRIRWRHVFKRPLVINYTDDSPNFPDKIPFICMLSDSSLPPSPGFTDGYMKFTYKDI